MAARGGCPGAGEADLRVERVHRLGVGGLRVVDHVAMQPGIGARVGHFGHQPERGQPKQLLDLTAGTQGVVELLQEQRQHRAEHHRRGEADHREQLRRRRARRVRWLRRRDQAGIGLDDLLLLLGLLEADQQRLVERPARRDLALQLAQLDLGLPGHPGFALGFAQVLGVRALAAAGERHLVLHIRDDVVDLVLDPIGELLLLGSELEDARMMLAVLARQLGLFARDLHLAVAQVEDQRRGQHLGGGFQPVAARAHGAQAVQPRFLGGAFGARIDQRIRDQARAAAISRPEGSVSTRPLAARNSSIASSEPNTRQRSCSTCSASQALARRVAESFSSSCTSMYASAMPLAIRAASCGPPAV